MPPARITASAPASDLTELVRAARARDDAAWTELYRRFDGLVRCVITSYRLQEADAADAASSTWLRAVERLRTLRDPERMGAWLRTIASRECLALLRRAGQEPPVDVGTAEVAATSPGPELVMLGHEARRALGDALDELGERGKRLIELMFMVPEVGYAEIARDTGMPVGSIGPTRGRALRRLRVGMERAGFDADATAASREHVLVAAVS